MTVNRGERVAVLGESGSGKSATALALMGLLPGSADVSGSILLDGEELVGRGEAGMRSVRGERLALVFQDPLSALNPVYTVGRQISEMFSRRRGLPEREARRRAVELMERVRIPHAAARIDDYPHQFSGGMRQRVVIAMALALSPSLLIADEPTTALDVTVQAQILALLRQLSDEEDMALILISHDLGVVASVAQRVYVMYGGQIVEHGATQPVYDRNAHPYTAGLMASLPDQYSRRERLVAVPGSPPDPRALPAGCRFHPRCGWAESLCETTPPELLPVDDGHRRSRCHFSDRVLQAGSPR
ncbi:ABC transporter ATP-binding protein [Jiangella asiatica]|uniref:ABC transporter ATP-binding protein n=2 Tax=Jiangella asiatica TaxID=2530372 RepID=A0A4R5DLK1_9ACTN|nr:ABC transporter ATP-binding protein [Jiangella asiatica]